MRTWLVAIALTLACGPTTSGASSDDGLDTTAPGDGTEAGSGSGTSTGDPPVATPCGPAPDAMPMIIRAEAGRFVLEAARYDGGQENFGCDVPPPCEGRYGTHVRFEIARIGDASLPGPGTYATEADSLSGTDRTCGCCNGEGGGPPDWDDTYPLSSATLVLDGADAGCVSGQLSGAAPFDGPFAATWCG